jgi:hypothetical protein
MFSSATIEIALGLVFFYLLLSLLITTLNELIAALFKFRGRHLRGTVTQMLGDQYKQLLYQHPLLDGTVRLPKTRLGKFFRTRLPSYLESKDFSKILTEIVAHELVTYRTVAKTLQGGDDGGSGNSFRINSLADETGASSPKDDIDTMSLDQVQDFIKRTTKAPNNFRMANAEGALTNAASLDIASELAKASRSISYGDAAEVGLGDLAKTIAGMGFPDATKSVILSLAKKAKGDIDVFKKELEAWFDNRMERTSGWYTRNLRLFTLAMSFVLVAGLNADTLFVVKKLSHDSEARKKMIAMATKSATELEPIFEKGKEQQEEPTSASPAPAPATSVPTDSATQDSATKGAAIASKPTPTKEEDSADVAAAYQLALRVDTLLNEDIKYASEVLGLGWSKLNSPFSRDYCNSEYKILGLLKKLAGLLLTVIALSLGAPFWFDLLKRIISIRSAGVNPDEKKGKATK